MSAEDERLLGLLARSREGHVASTSQLISALEEGRTGAGEIHRELHACGGNAQIVGITGSPGSGKSTLVSSLAGELLSRDNSVAVVAVDPSSAFTGGAILGDRIRMQGHALDPKVFVRSMSTRGATGGVSRATVDAVAVLDAAGWDYVIIETVGVGQAEVQIVEIAHTVVVVSVPGLGDDIQAIKAGLMEIADIHDVNKADRPGADKAAAELLTMLTYGPTAPEGSWAVPVLKTSALTGEGLPELVDAFEAHFEWLGQDGRRLERERTMAAARVRSIAQALIVDDLMNPDGDGTIDRLVSRVAARELDPHAAARELVGTTART